MTDITQNSRRRGVLFVFLAAVLYSIGGLCIKVIPWNGMSINGARNLVAILVVGGYLLFGRDFDGQTPESLSQTIAAYQAAAAVPIPTRRCAIEDA